MARKTALRTARGQAALGPATAELFSAMGAPTDPAIEREVNRRAARSALKRVLQNIDRELGEVETSRILSEFALIYSKRQLSKLKTRRVLAGYGELDEMSRRHDGKAIPVQQAARLLAGYSYGTEQAIAKLLRRARRRKKIR